MPANNPMAYLDPSLLQQQAQGLSAINELKMLPQSAQYAQALRQSEATLPEATGQGFARTGPNFMNLLGMMAERAGGRKKLGALDTRAQALRGQAQAGSEAELQAEEQRRQMEVQQQQQQLASEQAFQRERDKAAAGQVKGPFKAWYDPEAPEGKRMLAVSNTGEGPVDSQGNPVPPSAYPYQEPRGRSGGLYKMTPKQQTALEELAGNFSALDFVRGSFKDDYGSEKGLPVVNTFKQYMARKAPILTDKDTEEAAEWWSNYRRIYEIPIRHQFFGSALTESEKRLWQAANINPDMQPDQIRESLRLQEALWRKMGANARALALSKNPRNEEYVNTLFPPNVFFVDQSVEDEISRALKDRGLVTGRRAEVGSRVRGQNPPEIREGGQAPDQSGAFREFRQMQQNIQRIEQELERERRALEGAEVR